MANNISSTDFNEPEWLEFDSTPYGGGYDISTTYGKPLPPDDTICYPRSVPTQDSFSPYGSITIPPFNQRDFDTSIVPNVGEKPPEFGYNDTPTISYVGEEPPQFGYDYIPNGHNDTPIVSNGGYGYSPNGYYGYGRQVPEPPSEYIEPCATLFGYWPCLVKESQKNAVQQGCCEQSSYGNEWRRTEEYFFGSSYLYGASRDVGVSQMETNYGYERHHVEQPSYVQEEYNQQLWSETSYGYERHCVEQPSYVQEEYNQQLWSETSYGYDRHCVEQPSYVQEEYNQQLWSQQLNYSYYESYLES